MRCQECEVEVMKEPVEMNGPTSPDCDLDTQAYRGENETFAELRINQLWRDSRGLHDISWCTDPGFVPYD